MTETQFSNIAQLKSLPVYDLQDPAIADLRQEAENKAEFADFRETSEVDTASGLVLSAAFTPLFAMRQDMDGVIDLRVVFAHWKPPASNP